MKGHGQAHILFRRVKSGTLKDVGLVEREAKFQADSLKSGG